MSLRQHDRGEGVAVFTLVERIEFQSPSLNSGTCCFGESAVSGKHLIQSFLQQHPDGFPQTIEQVG